MIVSRWSRTQHVPLNAALEELVRVSPTSLVGEVIDLVVVFVVLVQQPLHLGPGIPVDMFCGVGDYTNATTRE